LFCCCVIVVFRSSCNGSVKANTQRRRRCNSVELATVSTSLNKFANSEVELHRVAAGVNAPVGSRRELVSNAAHVYRRLPLRPTRRNSTVESRRRRQCVCVMGFNDVFVR